MSNIGMPVSKWQINDIKNIFRVSARRHLLVTGQKGCGKTTLINLLADNTMPGVRSFLEWDRDGMPLRVCLSDRQGNGLCVIGQREGDVMCPIVQVLDEAGTELLHKALNAPGEWVCIDEMGYLEEASPAYQQALWCCFEKKRVFAVLRKTDTPLLRRLRDRKDCFMLDLDNLEGWR